MLFLKLTLKFLFSVFENAGQIPSHNGQCASVRTIPSSVGRAGRRLMSGLGVMVGSEIRTVPILFAGLGRPADLRWSTSWLRG